MLGIDFETVRFGSPQYLWLLIAPGALLVAWVWQLTARRRDARRFRQHRRLPVRERFPIFGSLVFWLGLVLIVVFASNLGWLPSGGPQGGLASYGDQLSKLILPIATLTLVTIALFSRYLRSSMIESIVQDYVRTARAKGASLNRVMLRHVLPNSLFSTITLLGLSIPYIFSGALIVEALFNYPGMGLLFWNAASSRDYPVILGVTLVVALATVAGNLVADLVYAIVDPRIRYTAE